MSTILFVSFQLHGQGGVETVLLTFARALHARGRNVSVALMGPSRIDREWELQLPHLEVGTGNGFFERLRWFHSLARKVKPDLVVVLSPMGAVLASLNRVFTNDTYSIASWMHIAPDFYGANVHMLRLCDTHIGICPSMTQQLEELTSRPAVTVWNPIQTDRSLLPRSRDGLSFVFIGRLDKIKRVDRILRALAGVSGSWKLTIVGDGSERQLLTEMSTNMRIEERVTWMGWVNDPWATLEGADIGLLSSDYEGLPLSVAEFLCHGVPVAAMDCGRSLRDLIVPDVNGWLVPPGNVQSLRSLLQSLVDGRQRIPVSLDVQETVKHLSADIVVSNFVNTIDSFFDGKRRRRTTYLADVLGAGRRWIISKLEKLSIIERLRIHL